MSALEDIKARVHGHTEGPWFAHQDFIDMGVEDATKTISNNPERYAGKFIASVGLDSVVKSANAELITAAPKLLAVLEAVEAEADALDALAEEVIGGDLIAGLRLAAKGIRRAITEALQ